MPQFPQILRYRELVVDLEDVDTWQFAVKEKEFTNAPHLIWHQTGEFHGVFYEVETEEDAREALIYLKSIGEHGIYYQNAGPSIAKV